MASFSFGDYADLLGRYRREWEGKSLDAKALEVAKVMTERATEVAQQDLGPDAAFTGGPGRGSGWRATTNWLETDAKLTGPGEAVVKPTGRSAGPWTVAERGRNQGETGRVLGPGISQKTGMTSYTKAGKVRKVRQQKGYALGAVGSRWNGVTAGKGTASRAGVVFEREVPEAIARIVERVNNDYFG